MILKKLWSPQETEQIIELKEKGFSDFEIARKVGRTPDSVSSRLDRLRRNGKIFAAKTPISQVPASIMPVWNDYLVSQGDAVILTDVEAPFQHSEFINRVLDLADAWGIQTLHLGGDLLHYDSLSAWGSEWVQDKEILLDGILDVLEQSLGTKKRAEIITQLSDKGLLNGDGLSSELKESRKVFKNLDGFKNIYVELGNHDDRYLRALQQALNSTELLHQLDTHNDPRWKIAPYYYALIETEAGTFRITHPRGAGQKTAVDLAIQFHQHVIMGHSHRWNISRDPSGKFWAIQQGHCVDEARLAYVQQRDAKRDAHMLGATIIRGGYPWVLSMESPWDLLKRM